MKHISTEIKNDVLKIAIDRPEKKNALTAQMYHEIRHSLESAANNDDIKAVLLYGTNDIFTAGNDLNDFNKRDFDGPSPASKLLMVLVHYQKPVVAAVSGLAIGIGATLLLHCDLVYAAPTKFRMPFIDLGVCPEGGSSLLLPKFVGHRKAAEILMLGDFFNTQKAIDIGLVNEEVSNDELISVAVAKAEALAKKPIEALKITKQLMKKCDQARLVEHMNEEFDYFGQFLQTPESQKIRESLLEKK